MSQTGGKMQTESGKTALDLYEQGGRILSLMRPWQISHAIAKLCAISITLLPWWIMIKGEFGRLEFGSLVVWLLLGFIALGVRDRQKEKK